MTPLSERLVVLGDVTSTMDEARGRPPGTLSAPHWVMADRQLKGRGRRGRDWVSPSGNLNATARFVWDGEQRHLPQLCFVAAVAACEAIATLQPPVVGKLSLKWPNDLLLGQGKLGGLLVESDLKGHLAQVAVGFGVNLVSVHDAGRDTAHLDGVAPQDLLATLDETLRTQLLRWQDHGFEPIRNAWERWGPVRGSAAAPSTLKGATGRYVGLDDDGSLILDMDHGRQIVSSGELS